MTPQDPLTADLEASPFLRNNLAQLSKLLRHTFTNTKEVGPEGATINTFVEAHAPRLERWVGQVTTAEPFHASGLPPLSSRLVKRLSKPPHMDSARSLILLRLIRQGGALAAAQQERSTAGRARDRRAEAAAAAAPEEG